MSDIVDTLELMARNYAYAARKLILLDASAEIQSLRMQNKSLSTRVNEAERRVRWLEQSLMNAYILQETGKQNCLSSLESMLLFPASGATGNTVRPIIPLAVKPTPEDFE